MSVNFEVLKTDVIEVLAIVDGVIEDLAVIENIPGLDKYKSVITDIHTVLGDVIEFFKTLP